MSGITISDFKIRVKIDTKDAIKGFRRLELIMATLRKNAAKALVINVKLRQSAEKLVQTTAKQAKVSAKAAAKAKAIADAGVHATRAFSGWYRQLRRAHPHLGLLVKGSIRLGQNMSKLSWWATQVTTGYKAVGSALGTVFNTRNLLLFGAGMGGILLVASKIADTVQFIVENGSKVKSSFATLEGVLGNLTLAKGMTPKALNQLKTQQKNFVAHLALTYGVSMSETAVDYAKFASASANNIGLGVSQDLFKSLTEYGTVMQVGPEKMGRVFTAFTQMANKNQVMAEELKTQLGDSLPGALEIFIKALNRTEKYGIVTTENIWKMMEQGKIVANDVFPYISQVMREFSTGALAEVLGTMTTKMNIMREAFYSVFTVGALNQFEKPMGRLFDMVTNLFSGKGFQVAVGSPINNFLLEIEHSLSEFEEKRKQFEKEYAAAKTNKEKVALADKFWEEVAWPGAKAFFESMGAKIYKWISTALNNFSAADFGGFISFLTDVFYQAFVGAMGLAKDLLIGNKDLTAATEEGPGRFMRFVTGDTEGGVMAGLGAAILDVWDVANGRFGFERESEVYGGKINHVTTNITVNTPTGSTTQKVKTVVPNGGVKDIVLMPGNSTTAK